jgi:hypothetical protein
MEGNRKMQRRETRNHPKEHCGRACRSTGAGLEFEFCQWMAVVGKTVGFTTKRVKEMKFVMA